MTIGPVVFVGVGGTGGKTLSVTYDTLRSQLDRLGFTSWPSAWQFLHIDVAADPDSVVTGMPDALPRSSYLALTTHESSYRGIDGIISDRIGEVELEEHIAWNSWRPYPPNNTGAIIDKGAGQWRAVGRATLMGHLDAVERAVDQVMDRLHHGDGPGLDTIQRTSGQRIQHTTPNDPLVFVVGSASGGSGSGMLLDVCDLLRARAREVYALVFTPEVFESDEGKMDAGIAPNSIIAINELAAANWIRNDADAPLSRNRLFQQARVQRPAGLENSQSGPTTTLLVGRRGQGITLKTPEDVYRVVGRSLAEITVNEPLSRDLKNFIGANNYNQTISNADNLGLSTGQDLIDPGVFKGLGFGRLSLGRDFFQRYAVERFQRMVSSRLLDQHLTLRRPNDMRTNEELIEAAAELVWLPFLVNSGLDEVNPKNDVVKELSPRGERANGRLYEAEAAFDRSVFESVTSSANTRGEIRMMDARREAGQKVTDAYEDSGLVEQARGLTSVLVGEWSRDIQTKMLRQIDNAVALRGLPVTVRLVRRLREAVLAAAKQLAEVDAVDCRAESAALRARLEVFHEGDPKDFRADDNDRIRALCDEAQEVLGYSIDAHTCEIASVVLKDLELNLLGPWELALRDADGILRRKVRPSEGVQPFTLWPTGEGDLPRRLLPSAVEFTLDDVDDFHRVFDDLVARSVKSRLQSAVTQGSDENLAAGLFTAVTEVIHGDKLPPQTQRLRPVAVYRSSWVPELNIAGEDDAVPMRAQPVLAYELEDLTARIQAWLRDSNEAIGRHLTESFGAYLAGEPTTGYVSAETRIDRQNRMVHLLRKVLECSRPLLSIERSMLQQIHLLNEPAVKVIAAELNVPPQLAELRAQLDQVQATSGLSDVRVAYTDTPSQDCLIVSVMDTACHPVEIASVMDPILRQWSGSRDGRFWSFRRARPLGEFVPLGPEARRNLILGWLVARLLGRGRVVLKGSHVERFEILVKGGWRSIEPSGIRPATDKGQIGSLVEALPVQFLRAYDEKSLDVIEPYRELIRLGAESRATQHASISAPNPIQDWIESGKGIVDVEGAELEDGADALARSEVFATRVTEWAETYATIGDPGYLSSVPEAQGNPSIEVLPDLKWAFTELNSLTRARRKRPGW